MLDQIPWPPATALFREAHRRREDGFAPLPRLDSACREALAVADALDVVEDGDGGVAGEDEIAVHAVDGEVGRDGGLGGGEALGDGSAAEDAAGAGRVPELAGVGVDVRANVGEGQEGEDGFDGGVGWVRREGLDQSRVFGHVGYPSVKVVDLGAGRKEEGGWM